jgi:hypothetical protein
LLSDAAGDQIDGIIPGTDMRHAISERRTGRWLLYAGVSVIALTFGMLSEAVHADEAGVSYWLPGRFGSLAAAPTVPGWSMAEVYYHTTVAASGAVAAAREIQIGRSGSERQLEP